VFDASLNVGDEIDTIDLDAVAYSVRNITVVDQDTPKQTRALETIARTLQNHLGH